MSRIGASIAGLERLLLNNIVRTEQAALTDTLRQATENIDIEPSDQLPLARYQALTINANSAISSLQQQQASVLDWVSLFAGI